VSDRLRDIAGCRFHCLRCAFGILNHSAAAVIGSLGALLKYFDHVPELHQPAFGLYAVVANLRRVVAELYVWFIIPSASTRQ